jgi:hypothetical protein
MRLELCQGADYRLRIVTECLVDRGVVEDGARAFELLSTVRRSFLEDLDRREHMIKLILAAETKGEFDLCNVL